MTKLLVIGALCTASALGVYAQYTTWCGEVVETVDDSFIDADEVDEFHKELDIAYCGEPNPNEQP